MNAKRATLLVTVALVLAQSRAQTTTATCSNTFTWSFNSLGQAPCLVAAYLGHQCSPESAFNVPPVTSGQQYLSPSGSQINKCQCSSVYYSLLSACAACQGSPISTFTEWTRGCSAVPISVESYPMATPNGTQIPPWAFMRLSDDVFSVIAAGRNATGDPSFGGQPSSGLSRTAIIALAIGTSIALLLVALAVWMFCKFRRKTDRGVPVAVESGSSSLNPDSSHNRVRYGRLEGPPRKERTISGLFQPSASKIKSYRPGLNFDLDKGRRGDLLELSESTKALNRRLDSSTSRLPSSHSGSGTTTRVSMESSVKLSKKKEAPPKVLSEPSVASMQPSVPLSNLFSRPKEVKQHKGDTRLDLTDGGPEPAPRASRDAARLFQDDRDRPSADGRPPYPI